MNKPNKQKIDWEKTFDKNWINPWERNNFGIPKAHLDIKDFISNLLQQQKEEIIKEIEGIVGEARTIVHKEMFDEEEGELFVSEEEIRERLKQIKFKDIINSANMLLGMNGFRLTFDGEMLGLIDERLIKNTNLLNKKDE